MAHSSSWPKKSIRPEPKKRDGHPGKWRRGRGTISYEFNAINMMNASARILNDVMEAEKVSVAPSEKQRQHIATEVFKKLSPSKIEANMKVSGVCVTFSDGVKVEM